MNHMVYFDNAFVLIKDSKHKKTSSLHMIIRKCWFDVLGDWRSVLILRFIKTQY